MPAKITTIPRGIELRVQMEPMPESLHVIDESGSITPEQFQGLVMWGNVLIKPVDKLPADECKRMINEITGINELLYNDEDGVGDKPVPTCR